MQHPDTKIVAIKKPALTIRESGTPIITRKNLIVLSRHHEFREGTARSICL